MCCLMYEGPMRSKIMKDNPAIVNLYKQTGRTNTQKNMDELFVRFLLK